jgi:hypothetical protein
LLRYNSNEHVTIKSARQLSLKIPISGDAEPVVARELKVAKIDWNKQMLIVISGGKQPTSGYSVELKSLRMKDGKLAISWKLNKRAPGTGEAFTSYPCLAILVDRFEGELVFDPEK